MKKRTSTGKRLIVAVSSMMLLGVAASSCYYDKEEILYPGSNNPVDCSITPSAFSIDVQPLIVSKCAIPGCHDASASGGVILQNYAQISTKIERINTRALVLKSMPPSGPLTPAEQAKIKCWIDGGGLNN